MRCPPPLLGKAEKMGDNVVKVSSVDALGKVSCSYCGLGGRLLPEFGQSVSDVVSVVVSPPESAPVFGRSRCKRLISTERWMCRLMFHDNRAPPCIQMAYFCSSHATHAAVVSEHWVGGCTLTEFVEQMAGNIRRGVTHKR
jgi:hypothetical protein